MAQQGTNMISLSEVEKQLPHTRGLIRIDCKFTVGGKVYEITATYKNKKMDIKGRFHKSYDPKTGKLKYQEIDIVSYDDTKSYGGYCFSSELDNAQFYWDNSEDELL